MKKFGRKTTLNLRYGGDKGSHSVVSDWKGCDFMEIVEKKTTNADRIRNMSDEELAMAIMCPAEYDLSFNKECGCAGDMNRNCQKCTLDWLQSEAE